MCLSAVVGSKPVWGAGGGPVVHSRVVQKFNFGETKTRKLLILSKGLLGNRIFILVIVLLFFF